ncbi:hypothetical protein TNCV_1034081 [Trichonephila clavipes]|nr:hypothetical protein TNCV_1034081 [Trichonephila clavipes]
MGVRYAYMLKNHIIPSLADKHKLEETTFIQEDDLPHITTHVKDLLSISYGEDRALSCHLPLCLASQVPRPHSD